MRGVRFGRRGNLAARLQSHTPPGGPTPVGSIAHGNTASGAGPATVTLPQAATAGNLLVIEFSGTGSGVRALTTPSGWTLAQSASGAGASAGMLWVLWKFAAGGETSQSVAWTGGNMVAGWRAFEFSGVNATPIAAAPAFTVDLTAGATLGITGTTRTTAAANEYQLAVAGGRGVSGGFNTHSFGGGYTESDTTATGGTAVGNSAARTDATAGTVITPTFTFTNAQGSPVTIFGNISIASV